MFAEQPDQTMENLAASEFRRQVGEYINQTYYAGKGFILTKGEKQVAALVPMAMVNRLAELEAFYAQTIADQQQATGSADVNAMESSEASTDR